MSDAVRSQDDALLSALASQANAGGVLHCRGHLRLLVVARRAMQWSSRQAMLHWRRKIFPKILQKRYQL
jgi:hypothetical protein